MQIDWQQLRGLANAAMNKAYAPYSNFPVGAAALTTTGELV
jgi:cytidine deaminase